MHKYKVFTNKGCQIIIDGWQDFCDRHTIIKAAGGIVYNSVNQQLMIFRNGKWDLPKGKLEIGENVRDCAIRELEEETGVCNLEIISFLETTYHTYKINDQEILKSTYWFKMFTDYDGVLSPQDAEGISQVEWVSREGVLAKLDNSYDNIRQLLK